MRQSLLSRQTPITFKVQSDTAERNGGGGSLNPTRTEQPAQNQVSTNYIQDMSGSMATDDTYIFLVSHIAQVQRLNTDHKVLFHVPGIL